MNEFVTSLRDVFAPLGAITIKPMFGGHGLYYDGLMFALVANEVLYLKVDKQSQGIFIEQGLEAFSFEKNGKLMKMSYHQAPESVFEDPDRAKEWGVRAYEAALRASKPAKKSAEKSSA